jgi:hypothetical protein
MADYFKMEQCRRHYLPMCACNILISCLSVGFALWVGTAVYLVYFPAAQVERFLLLVGFGFLALIFHCNFMIAGGSGVWLKIALAILVFCIITVLVAIALGASFLNGALAVFFPLSGLLFFNRKRHKECCLRFAKLRCQLEHLSREGGSKVITSKFGPIDDGSSGLKKKTSKRETALHNQLRDRAKKSTAFKKKNSMVRKLGSSICAFVLVSITGCGLYLVCESFGSGVASLGGKTGPVVRYSVASNPGMYWFAMSVYASTVMIGVVGLRVQFFFRKLERGE